MPAHPGPPPSLAASGTTRSCSAPAWPGLLAARVLADAYAQVTVIDRDQLPRPAATGVASPRAGTCTRCWLAASRPWRSCSPDLTRRAGRPRGADRGLGNGRWYLNGHRLGQTHTGLVALCARRPFLEGHAPGAGPAQPAVPGRLRPPRAGHDARWWPRHRDAGAPSGRGRRRGAASRRPGGRRHRPRLLHPNLAGGTRLPAATDRAGAHRAGLCHPDLPAAARPSRPRPGNPPRPHAHPSPGRRAVAGGGRPVDT